MLALRYMGDGEFRAFYPKLADRKYVVGEVLHWEVVEDDNRSSESHRQFFGLIARSWTNLPEHLVDELPNPEALRKFALIKCGYCFVDKHVMANNQAAIDLVSSMRRSDRDREEYRIIAVEGRIVTVWEARSCKFKKGDNGGMGRREFQEMKEKVLTFVSQLIGTDVMSLKRSEAA
jgi:hypothetical protein